MIPRLSDYGLLGDRLHGLSLCGLQFIRASARLGPRMHLGKPLVLDAGVPPAFLKTQRLVVRVFPEVEDCGYDFFYGLADSSLVVEETMLEAADEPAAIGQHLVTPFILLTLLMGSMR